MQGSHLSSGSQESSSFARVLASSHSLFTPKRVGFTLAGAFVFAGAAAALNVGGSSQGSASGKQNFTFQSSSDNTAPTEGSGVDPANPAAQSSASSDGSASNTNNTSVNVTVNGQSISVPDNGSVHETVPTEDGSGQSSVSVHQSTNKSNSSLNVNVNSSTSTSGTHSHSSSQTVITQNGKTTVTH